MSVICTAFNQEPFVAMALEGFLHQETSFRTELLIHDDASTDGTASVIRDFESRYPGRFRCIYQKENQYGRIGNRIVNDLLVPMSSGEFVAICEGDDYWTDRRKLEKQVAFMRRRPEVSMSFHAARVNQYGEPASYSVHRFSGGPTVPSKTVILGGGGLYPTCSVMFRRDVLVDFPEFFRGLAIADSLWALNALSKGEIGYIDEIMAVYNAGVPDSWSERARRRPLSETLEYLRTLEAAREAFDDLTGHRYSRWIARRRSKNRVLALVAVGVGSATDSVYRELKDGIILRDRCLYWLRVLESRLFPKGSSVRGRHRWNPHRNERRSRETGCRTSEPTERWQKGPIGTDGQLAEGGTLSRPSSPVRGEHSPPWRPTVLYLARSFPPISSIASVRSKNVAKHLTRLGWNVRVVSPNPGLVRPAYTTDAEAYAEVEGIERILTDYHWRFLLHGFFAGSESGLPRLVARLGRRVGSWLGFEDGAGWVRPILRACSGLRRGEVDVVLATGSPFLSFFAARILSRRLACPYVLDYRDPWTASPHSSPAPRWVRTVEQGLLRCAAAVTVVSPAWSELLGSLAPGTTISTVTNGYDPESMATVAARRFTGKAVVYTGGFYPPKRVLVPFFRAMRIARREIPDLEFHYFGSERSEVQGWARAEGGEAWVRCHGPVRRAEAWAALKGAMASLVVTSVFERPEPLDIGILPGKLFESIGLRSPVLLVAPEGTDARALLSRANAGFAASGHEIDAMAAQIVLWSRGVGLPTWEDADRFSWPSVVRALDRTLRHVVRSRMRSRARE